MSRKKEDTIHHTLTCNLNKCCPIFGRPFLKRFALCYRTVICLSVLSLCDVGVLWPNGLMDQDETWHGGRPQPRPHCVRWGPSSQKKGHGPLSPSPIFSLCLLWANVWMDQNSTWYGGRPRPRPHCVSWGHSSPERGTAAPSFRPMSVVDKRSPISATAENVSTFFHR